VQVVSVFKLGDVAPAQRVHPDANSPVLLASAKMAF
jgi:hypothetical protein